MKHIPVRSAFLIVHGTGNLGNPGEGLRLTCSICVMSCRADQQQLVDFASIYLSWSCRLCSSQMHLHSKSALPTLPLLQAYTASALSLMLTGFRKPIVLTGRKAWADAEWGQ